MKSWFPFTDYDFYAYLTSGALALAVADYLVTGGVWLGRSDWTFVQIVLAVASAYVIGQVAAWPSSIILEYGLARLVLPSPMSVLLLRKKQGWLSGFVGRFLVGRYYSPLNRSVQDKIMSVAAAQLGVSEAALEPESVFQVAFRKAREDEDTRERLDGFRNQYGFCRNIAFVAAVAAFAVVFIVPPAGGASLRSAVTGALALVALGMTVRFLKFYSAFAAETVRALLK